MSYGGDGRVISVPPAPKKEAKAAACACTCANGTAKVETNGAVDFMKMTAAQKIAYHKAKWDRILG
jgi:hypothetical protein